VRATEQYPAGLGATVQPLSPYPDAVLAKTMFSALDDPDFPALLPVGSVEIVVAGCEAHVCVLQTVRAARRGDRHVGDGALRVAAGLAPPPVPRGAAAT
jgi:nicotinamidase-related amidase